MGETGGKKKGKGRIQKVLTDQDFPPVKRLARLQRVSGCLKPEEGDAARLLTVYVVVGGLLV